MFDQRGGTFGRADSNTWVLPDPDKFLSSCHCEIIFADNQFYLEDKSTNGTFINGGFEPLGRGTRHQLRDGDFFEIGDYRFSIQLQLQQQPPVGAFASPFDLAPAYPGNAPLFNEVPDTDFFGQGAGDTPALFDQQQDPLALWDKQPPQPRHSSFDQPRDFASSNNKESDSLLDDFVGVGKPTIDAGFAAVDIAPGMDQAVSWPSATSENLIPEDWADDLMNPASQASRRAPIKPGIVPDDSLTSPFGSEPKVTPTEMPFEVPKPNTRIPLAERILGMEAVRDTAPPVQRPDTPQDTPAPPVATVVPEVKTQVQAQVALAAKNSPDNSANRILMEALGLDMSRLSDADMVEISRITGLLMREIVEGMLGVLRSRASIKNEFRMNVTTIQPVENNPLKFSVSVDDALENLFIKKSNAYKKPVEAFREGFQEIAEHQLAMIAGIRQGFEAMMERFNPEQLEKTFSKQVKGSVIPGMQKAKFWSSYTDYYQGFTDNMEFSFQHLFGSDFVSAYEDQLRRLTAARKRGESNNE
jgi:type VI secretion system FHA domain protein